MPEYRRGLVTVPRNCTSLVRSLSLPASSSAARSLAYKENFGMAAVPSGTTRSAEKNWWATACECVCWANAIQKKCASRSCFVLRPRLGHSCCSVLQAAGYKWLTGLSTSCESHGVCAVSMPSGHFVLR